MVSSRSSSKKPSALQQFRARQKREGLARVEVQVRREDAALVRDIAHGLSNPSTERGMRLALKACLHQALVPSLKDHLCAQTFDDLEFERSKDVGRDIAL